MKKSEPDAAAKELEVAILEDIATNGDHSRFVEVSPAQDGTRRFALREWGNRIAPRRPGSTRKA